MALTKLTDFRAWFFHLFLARLFTWIPLKYGLPLSSSLGSLLSSSKMVWAGYQKKLENILPDVPGDAGKRYASQLVRTVYERLHFPAFVDEAGISHLFEIEGREQLEKAIARGNGAILVASHFGPFEAGYLLLARLGYKIHVIRAITDRSLGDVSQAMFLKIAQFRMEILRNTAVDFVFYKPGIDFGSLLSDLLTQNEIVLIWPESAWGKHFVDSPFLNGTIRLSSGFAYLAWKNDVPVIPFFCLRKSGRYKLVLEEPYWPDMRMDNAITGAVDHYANFLSRYVSEYPEQWNFAHKTRIIHEPSLVQYFPPSADGGRRFYDFSDFNL